MNKIIKNLLLIFFLLIFLSSCIGVTADIQMRKDGSGRIILEYRFSHIAETIGRLDGNEKWPLIPAGRADFERTIGRIPGMKLVSFSSRGDSKNTVNKVTLDFKDTESLLKFLDPSGRRAFVSRENSVNKLHLTLSEGGSLSLNPDLLDLMKQTSAGYRIGITFSSAGNSTMTLTGGSGKETTLPAAVEIVPSGKKVSLSIETARILSITDGLGVVIGWE